MSLHLNPNMCRLTVLGSGWGNMSLESGPAFTVEGQLWDEIAVLLDYDTGSDVDWDLIAQQEWPDFDWSDVIYTDLGGTVYTDFDGDGIWTDPLTGIEYPGGGTMWVPQGDLLQFSDMLDSIADSDENYAQYNIPQDVLNSIKGGPISIEQQNPSAFGDDGPHRYEPYCYVIQLRQTLSVIFNAEIFHHLHNSGEYDIDTTTIVIRDGSSKTVYYGDCNTHNYDVLVPSPYNGYPKAYICWQCLYGPFSEALIGKTEDTITSDEIRAGTSGLPSMIYGGGRYYATTK